MVLSLLQKKELNNIFKKLELHELQHVMNVLKENNVKITKTLNAVLFLETEIPENVLEIIYNYSVQRFSESMLYRQVEE